jgi:hypothetical protein
MKLHFLIHLPPLCIEIENIGLAPLELEEERFKCARSNFVLIEKSPVNGVDFRLKVPFRKRSQVWKNSQ